MAKPKNEIRINEKYQPLFTQPEGVRYFIVTGGRASGKSFAVSLAVSAKLAEMGHTILYTRYTMTSAEKSVIPEYLEKLEILGTHNRHAISAKQIINLDTKSSIWFSGIRTSSGNQTAALKSIKELTGWVLDEGEELVDERTFSKIDKTIRSKKQRNFVVIVMNPATKDHFIYKRFFEKMNVPPGFNGVKRNVCYIHTTFEDNRDNLPEEYIQSIYEEKYRNPDAWEHEVLGGWKEKAEGVIITNWKVGPYLQLENRGYGQDFGFNADPTVLVEVSCDIEHRILYVKECYREHSLKTNQIAELNKKHAGLELIVSDIEPRLIHEIKMQGVNIRPVKKKDKHLASSIALLQDFLIIVDPSSTELIKEFNLWSWHPNKPVPMVGHDHGPDAIRYILPRLYTRKRSGVYKLR